MVGKKLVGMTVVGIGVLGATVGKGGVGLDDVGRSDGDVVGDIDWKNVGDNVKLFGYIALFNCAAISSHVLVAKSETARK